MSKKILIITPSWIGDCVMTQPLYRHLHELHPGCTIDTFASRWSMAVFERMPEINHIIKNPFGHDALELKKRWHIGRELGKQGYDQVIVPPGSLRSALIVFTTGIKQHTGCIGEPRYLLLNDIRKLDKATLPLMVDRYTALAHPTQVDFGGHSDNPRFTISPESYTATLAKYGLSTDKPAPAFYPGAEYGPAKHWPARHFTELGHHYLTQSWQVWLFSSQKDFDIAKEINRLSDDLCTNLRGKTSLSEAINLLPCADIIVCSDNDLIRLAAALDRRLVAAYGSSSPDHTPSLSPKTKIISLHLKCSPCFEHECPSGHTDCLNKLTPDTVQRAAEELVETESE